MDIYTLKALSPAERRSILEGETTEETTYLRPLSQDELSEVMAEMSQALIAKEAIEDEKREAMADFKDRIKPYMKQIRSTLDMVKTKHEQITGPVYKISDFPNQMIHTVDPDGNVLGSRRMKPEERQLTINQKAS